MQSVHIDMNIAKWLFSAFHRVGDLRAAVWRLRVSTVLTSVAAPHFTPDKYDFFTKLRQRLLLSQLFRACPLFSYCDCFRSRAGVRSLLISYCTKWTLDTNLFEAYLDSWKPHLLFSNSHYRNETRTCRNREVYFR